jgi:acetoin utilization deacetylase AcuC-like enzyme
MIIDWDVHHGNGTQEIFYKDPTVFYFSTHQYPFYPGTGGWEEKGEGEGKGFTQNVPMPAGCGDEEYLQAFENYLLPAAEKFEPELILISAGFDAHQDDPLANMRVTEEGFRILSQKVVGLARKYSKGRLVSMLEGGYNLTALAKSVGVHLETLSEQV